jgi:uncharacterized protein YkwD
MAAVRPVDEAVSVTGSPRRRLAVIASLVVVLLLAGLAALLADSTRAAARQRSVTSQMPSLAAQVLADLNVFRAQHHLVALRVSRALNRSAANHSLEMATDGYFAHNSHDGSAFWKRIQAYYPARAHAYWSVGENLLWSSPDVDAAAALQLWEKSPEHLANMLSPRWRQIGISAVHATAAPGVFEGMEVTIITTDFGVRRY